MERTIDELKEALSSLKVNSTGLAEPTRLYDLAGQCQFYLGILRFVNGQPASGS